VLSCHSVSVNFGGLHALGDVNLEVHHGEIVGLIGPNGAGKTTLMECASGFQRIQRGALSYTSPRTGLSHDLVALPPHQRAELGVGRTLQNVRLFPYLTVTDNIRIALHRHQRHGVLADAFALPAARAEERRVLERAERLIGLVNLGGFAEQYASELSYGTLRLLELACMLALEPQLLLLDEPSSGISQKETEALGPLLRDIRQRTGATMLIIEHDMPLVMGLSDWIYCLDAGRNLAEGPPESVQRDAAVIEAYLGTARERRALADTIKASTTRRGTKPRPQTRTAGQPQPQPSGELLLEVEGIDVHYDRLRVLFDVYLRVHRGERVALLGTNGAGKSTLLKAVSGLVGVTAGDIRWKGTTIKDVPAERMVSLGLGHVPGGRGLFPTLSVEENLRMGGYLYDDPRRVDQEVERVLRYFPWMVNRMPQAAGTLSGGEQQQLATGRALMARPELLLIDELSLGLAPIVIEQLLEALQQLHRDEGLTLLIVEQQASFALAYTDRAYFLEKGEVRYEGSSAGLAERPDLLRSVFLAGAAAGFRGG
jgi:ABC-type branched-subunit amino acid transport system ATPase component